MYCDFLTTAENCVILISSVKADEKATTIMPSKNEGYIPAGASASHADALADRLETALHQFSPQAAALWAKSGDESGSLSLPRHLADAACVAEALWESWVSEQVKRYLEDVTGLDESSLGTLVAWLAGTHDVGKATRAFSRQIEETPQGQHFVSAIAESGLSLGGPEDRIKSRDLPHGIVSKVLLSDWLFDSGCLTPYSNPDGVRIRARRIANSIAEISGAHHGILRNDREEFARDINALYPPDWHDIQEEIVNAMSDAIGIRTVLPKLRKLNADSQQLLTAIVVMADWIASNQELFPYVITGSESDRAGEALDRVDLTAPWYADLDDLESNEQIENYYRQCFGWNSDYSTRPIQREVVELVRDVDGPCLMIIEAPTGEGKTEAGLAAAKILVAHNGSQGVLVATPTMATANGLFERVERWAEANTEDEDVTSMFLAHSKRDLFKPFRRLQMRDIHDETDGPSGVEVSRWFVGRYRGILANFVVATVDQVLTMALQQRYSMLRHLGLAGKVLIIDECHAYDAYMSSYLEKALKWLARYHVPVILMSATLPLSMKNQLAGAYYSELSNEPLELIETGYPLITLLTHDGVVEKTVSPRPTQIHAQVSIIDDDLHTLMALMKEQTQDGGCVLLVCNTIRRAQEVYRALTAEYPGETELHHSAFMAAQRSDKEDALRELLGPNAHRGAGRPWRRFIVATQVVEQSLDIDADMLVTDIAPMDLLVQRAGRMHRHIRPESDRPARMREPHIYLRGVVKQEPAPEFESGTEFIYDPALLMATLHVVNTQMCPKGFRRPDDIAPLVHEAYDSDIDVPDGWQESWDKGRTESAKRLDCARKRSQTFQIPGPQEAAQWDDFFARYTEAGVSSSEEAGLAQVRDTVPTIEVIPVQISQFGYQPLGGQDYVGFAEAPDFALAHRFASSTLRLPARFSRDSRTFDEVVTELEQNTPSGWAENYMLRGALALCLDQDREITLAGRKLCYSTEEGLLDLGYRQ